MLVRERSYGIETLGNHAQSNINEINSINRIYEATYVAVHVVGRLLPSRRAGVLLPTRAAEEIAAWIIRSTIVGTVKVRSWSNQAARKAQFTTRIALLTRRIDRRTKRKGKVT